MTGNTLPLDSNTSRHSHPELLSEAKRERVPQRRGGLVISLDFELQWGAREMRRLDAAERARLLAARAGIPRMLDMFEEFSVHATWATVGLLFAHSKKEAEAFRPKRQPSYADERLQPYREQTGNNERDDPFHFAPSIIAKIAEYKGQEIASHSFSHYYSLEQGQRSEEFDDDLQSAIAIAANSGYTLKSYVFPRNQANPAYLPSLQRLGFSSYRSNELVATKMANATANQRRPHKRIARLLDSFINIDGYQTVAWPKPSALTPIQASRYLRSYRPVFRPFEHWLLERVRGAMKHAAQTGEIFHLWWHPEDFAYDYTQNLRVLRQVLETFDHYRAQYEMASLSMAEVVDPAKMTQVAGACHVIA